MLLGISKLKNGRHEAQHIVQTSDNFDMLYINGISNQIEQEKERKEMKRAMTIVGGKGGIADFNDLGDLGESVTTGQGRVKSMAPQTHGGLQRNDSELLLHERQRPKKAFFES